MRRNVVCLFCFLGILSIYFSPKASAQSTEQVIYSFGLNPDCGFPTAPLIADAQGNLYGATFADGAYNNGCIFELTRSGSGWVETVLYNFTGGADGNIPEGALTFDKSGNLIGNRRRRSLRSRGDLRVDSEWQFVERNRALQLWRQQQ
jgi:uncharacterized repeat protein (TIGR03803 family)